MPDKSGKRITGRAILTGFLPGIVVGLGDKEIR